MGLRDKIIKDRSGSPDGDSTKKKVIVSGANADEEAERRKYVESHPNKEVTQKEYDYLMDLYKKAEAADSTGSKPTKESEEFQKAYHEILPEEASRIIAKHPVKTKKAIKEGRSWWDLEGNVDAYFGPRTKQYMEELTKKKPAVKEPEKVPTPPVIDDKKKEEVGPQEVIVSHGDQAAERQFPPIKPQWWLQDQIGALNAGLNYIGMNPYYPWRAQPTYRTPKVSYLSPERALAENQSQMKTAMESLSRFSGPQSFNARLGDISGKGFANAANTIADVHNRNIQLFNQNSAQEAGIKNQETRERAEGATKLWDDYQAVRQNFDTAKAASRDALAKTVIQGITNRANTYNLNQMNPQFAVNPGQGGTMFFHDPRKMKPGQSATALSDKFASKLADPRFKAMANTDQGRSILWKMTQDESGINSNDDYMGEYQRSRQRSAGNQTPAPDGYPT